MDRSRSRNRALFVTFEGTEGVGKSTQVHALAKFYGSRGLSVFTTREPGGTAIGNEIRAILCQSREQTLHPLAELFLLEAARAQHVHEVLREALQKHDLVLCDRYADASVAYQGGGRGLGRDWVRDLNERTCGDVVPDLTILLDMTLEVALERAIKRLSLVSGSSREDRFEREAMEFHKRVREGYLETARLEPKRFFIVNAAQEKKHLTELLVERIDLALAERK